MSFNQRPALDADAGHIAFTCGPTEGPAAPGTALCEVAIDGSGLRTVSAASLAPRATSPDAYVGSADYTAQGALVAEGNLTEVTQLWTIGKAGDASAVAPDVVSDTSPCILPDGRIASVWGGRSPGLHELKIANPDGSNAIVLAPGVDIADVGIGCGL